MRGLADLHDKETYTLSKYFIKKLLTKSILSIVYSVRFPYERL